MSSLVRQSIMVSCSAAALLAAATAAAQTTSATTQPDPATAAAQSAPATTQPDAATTATEEEGGIRDVIVTAQRREERLQTVPIAITALDAQDLERNAIRDITRLQVQTPGLTVGQTGSDSRPAMRGVKTDQSRGVGADASVAFYIDGVYQPTNQQALVGFLDLARVEVQRGPQGTLYGRNSFGGNIVLVTNLPTDKFEGSLRGEYGSFDRYRVEGVLNLPLGETLGLRLAGYRERSNGYVRNISPTGTRAQDLNDWYGRATLRWEPSSDTDLTLRGSVWAGNGRGGGAYEYKVLGILTDDAGNQSIFGKNIQYVNPRANQGDIPTLPAAGVPVPLDPYTLAADYPFSRRIRNYQGSIELNHRFDGFGIKLLSSYDWFDAQRRSDGDFTQYPVRINLQQSRSHNFTWEAQVASQNQSPFQWIAGAFYLNQSGYEYFQQFRITQNRFTDNDRSNTGTEAYAFFGQASYKLTEELRLTGGVRWTHDTKTSFGYNFVANAPKQRFKSDFEKVTWRGALDYQVTPTNLLYASVSSGYRAGGNNTDPSLPANLVAIRPETVTAYEIGSKNRFLANTLQFNVSAFINRFHDLQVVSFKDPYVFTQNVGEETARGVEAELEWRPTPPLTINATASYLDAKLTKGIAIDPIDYNRGISLNGFRVPMSPEWRFTGAIQYEIPLGSFGTLTPRVQTSYSSSFYVSDFNTPIEFQGSNTRSDARLTYRTANQNVTLEAFVTNIENKAVKGGGEFGGRGAYFIGYLPPRQYGVSLGFRF